MSKNSVTNRIISALLIVSVLLSNFIYYGFTSETSVNTNLVIGSTAKITDTSVQLSKNPLLFTDATDSLYDIDASEFPELLVVTNYCYDEYEQLWFEVDAAPGYAAWPSEYRDYRYICDYSIEILSGAINFVFDESGKRVENSILLGQYDRIKLVGASSMQGNVEYNWQIYTGDEWVNIYDADEREFYLSLAVVASTLDDDLQTQIRLAARRGLIEMVSETITVTVVPYTDAGTNAAFYVAFPSETLVESEALEETESDEEQTPLEESKALEETDADENEEPENADENEASDETEQNETDETEQNDEPNDGADEEPDGSENGEEQTPFEETEGEEGESVPEDHETDAENPLVEIAEPEADKASEPAEPEETAEPDAETENADADPEQNGGKKLSDFPTPEEEAQPESEKPEADENANTATYDENDGTDEDEKVSPLEALVYMFAMTACADEGEGSTESKMYNVVINYLFEKDHSVAANPYTATWGESSTVNATVTFPTVLGYEPYVMKDGALVRRDTYVFENKTFTEDFTLNVYYKPALVEYRVNVWLQNVDNEQYTLDSTEVLKGYTDSEVPMDMGLFYGGFKQLLHDQPKIAADGSTQLDVYFDREYYLMKFNLDAADAYGAQPIYARFGAETRVKDPTRPGYSFLGWADVTDGDNNTLVDLPQNMPAKNTVWKAVWLADPTAKVSVVVWGENPDDKEYSYQKTETINVKPGTTITYTNDSTSICGCGEHIHGATCTYTCGKDEHTHSVENGCYTFTCTENDHNHTTAGCTLNCTHTHTTSCYKLQSNWYTLRETTKPTQTLTDKGNGIYTYTNRRQTYYVVQIGDKWYAPGNNSTTKITYNCSHTHDDSCYTCGKTAGKHTHTIESCPYTLTCPKEAHTHTDSCYNCGKTQHKHSDSCYLKLGTVMDSNLWTYEKSDRVTVEADGTTVLNVYYTRKKFTLRFRNKNSSTDDYGTIEEKWGADIRKKFEAKNTQSGTALWSTNQNGSSPWTGFLDEMPSENRTYYANSSKGSTHTATYYGEELDGTYEVIYTSTIKYDGNLTVTDEDKPDIKGYEFDRGTVNGKPFNEAEFYYKRASFQLQYNNGEGVKKIENVKYEAPLATYEGYMPEPPSIYETGSVEFDGWYYNPECSEGAKVDWNKTMPANDMIVYAKWKKVYHTVTVYIERDKDGGFDESKKYEFGGSDRQNPYDILHGETIDDLHIPNDPTKGNYDFIGWFYVYADDSGNAISEEQAWDFEEMTVTRDIKIYAKWTSSVMVPYEINYVLKSDPDTQIADAKKGSMLAGTNKSFDAKGGDELYAGYQEGYFPTTRSHTISPTVEDGKVTFNFEYVQKDAVPYTVKYLEEGTNRVLNPEKTVSDNRKAVVTENYELILGYMPDKFQKTLIIVPDEENEIIFYYTKDDTRAGYRITHWLQNADRTGYTVIETRDGVGNIGDNVSESSKTYVGYKFNPGVAGTKTSGKLEQNKLLELNLYYDRVAYPYKVRYLDRATGNELASEKKVTAEADRKFYGEVITENAIAIPNYTAEQSSVQYTIGVESDENLTDPKNNVITVWYNENSVDINYVVVGPTGCGTVNPTVSHLGVISGTGASSTATANAGYRFVGWYSDANCTALVSASTVLVLTKPTDGWKAATYYAKFEYALAPLTVKKSGAKNIDENQTFIFRVEGTDAKTSGVDLKVVISGNGSVTVKDLPIGEYKITEYTDWSWRYTPENGTRTITLQPNNSNEVAFVNTRDEEYWLNGAAYSENAFNVNN